MEAELQEVARRESGRVLASLIRFCGDFDLAEEALQDALLEAAESWREGAIPLDAGAWLRAVARNKALDRIRREGRRSDRERTAVELRQMQDADENEDDLLRLVFTCCHPSLSTTSQSALCLRTVCGLRSAEVARLLLCSESTVSQRISRAKAKISRAGIPYRIPSDEELPSRLPAVLAVVYLLFTTGHHAPFGESASRRFMALEAIELARLLVKRMPREPEAIGLLALLLATEARAAGRVDALGDAVTLLDQNRRAWDGAMIQEASRAWRRSIAMSPPGPFTLQAGISCLHSLAASFEETDWSSIAQLYRQLEAISPTVVVRVNRAIAESWRAGPAAGLMLLDEVPAPSWGAWWTARADFCRRLGEKEDADQALQRALECEPNETDRRLLERIRCDL